MKKKYVLIQDRKNDRYIIRQLGRRGCIEVEAIIDSTKKESKEFSERIFILLGCLTDISSKSIEFGLVGAMEKVVRAAKLYSQGNPCPVCYCNYWEKHSSDCALQESLKTISKNKLKEGDS
jgi:hypothetical protein